MIIDNLKSNVVARGIKFKSSKLSSNAPSEKIGRLQIENARILLFILPRSGTCTTIFMMVVIAHCYNISTVFRYSWNYYIILISEACIKHKR